MAPEQRPIARLNANKQTLGALSQSAASSRLAEISGYNKSRPVAQFSHGGDAESDAQAKAKIARAKERELAPRLAIGTLHEWNDDAVAVHLLGPMTDDCDHCASLNFPEERVGQGHFSIC